MSPVLRTHFAEYAAFHGTRGNQACHYVGIPLIVLGIFGMLVQVPLAELAGVTVTLAELLLVATTVYYLTLDAALGVMMFAASVILAAAGRWLGMPLSLTVFVVGWVFQFIGHYVYEKKSPAFLRNLTHLLVGPLWILAKATRRA